MVLGSYVVTLNLILERRDSKEPRWATVEDESDLPQDYPSDWADDLGCIECGVLPFPGDDLDVEPGDRIHVRGPVTISFTKTFYPEVGYECDTEIDWDDDGVEAKVIKAPLA